MLSPINVAIFLGATCGRLELRQDQRANERYRRQKDVRKLHSPE